MSQTPLYAMHTLFKQMAQPWQIWFEGAAQWHKTWATAFPNTPAETFHNYANACYETTARMLNDYGRPDFRVNDVEIDGTSYDIEENMVEEKDFARLIHFKKLDENGEPLRLNHPKLLIVAPLSGHFATLLRNTIRYFLPDHDVYITDWKNARNIPVSKGKWDTEDQIEDIRSFIQTMGPNTHVVGVCQGAAPALAATALMEADKDPNQPLSISLFAAPINPIANITQPVNIAMTKGFSFFKTLIGRVIGPYEGLGREVYSGLLQLTGFITMNLSNHIDAHKKQFENLTVGDQDSADKHNRFYTEYLSVLDMTKEFYLKTIKNVFIDQLLPKGELTVKGRLVDLSKITKTALLTVEGLKDDISAYGQTFYAHRLCKNIPANMQRNILNHFIGHYGSFNGSRCQKEIVPGVAHFIREMGAKAGLKYDPIPKSHIQPVKPRTAKQAWDEEYQYLLDKDGIALEHFVDKKSKNDPPKTRNNKQLVPVAA
ncbi:MAG: polyhydroxyalkanoate depolymerase [Alphaproteobacteria bacterium]|nr:polyhydroxyalkanoate depolymerase [Alphaproteobacteria bacterium]